MSRAVRWVVVLSSGFALGSILARAEQAKTAPKTVVPAAAQAPAAAPPTASATTDQAKEAAMAKMQALGSPGEAHQALQPLVGSWTYTGQFWMAPDGPPQTMTGTANNTLIFGGRFLKQEYRGESKDMPAFEGLGITGYDNIRKEYASVWLDNMATGIMTATGQFDAASKSLGQQGDFSCPMTGEAHRKSRSVWKIIDANHNVYESYMTAPDGREFKSMTINYTRAS